MKGSGPPLPPPFIVTWDSEICGPYFNVVVDAIGPETDFTLDFILEALQNLFR